MNLGLVSCPHIHRQGGKFFKFADSENTKSILDMRAMYKFILLLRCSYPHKTIISTHIDGRYDTILNYIFQ